MEIKRIERMADKIAADEVKDPLVVVDQSVDAIIQSIIDIGEALPKVESESPEEKKILDEVTDIMETAIAPYMSDVAKALDKLGDS